MADWTGIANLALLKLGRRQLTDLLTDTSDSANAIRGIYLTLADEVLYARPWSVAKKRFMLGASGAAPLFGLTYAYDFPTDPYALRCWQVGDDDDFGGGYGGQDGRWTVEGRQVLTDLAAPLPCVFVVRPTDANGVLDPNKFVGLLGTAMAYRIGWAVAYRLTQSRNKEDEMQEAYERALEMASSIDTSQQTPRPADADEILRARY